MPDSSDSLDKILRGAGGKAAPKPDPAPTAPEDPDALTIADMNGTHSMRPANKNLTRLHVVLKDGKVRSFQYAFLDVESRFGDGAFEIIFAGTRHWQVKVKGRGPRFWAVYDYLTLHRWPYLKEAAGSMPDAIEGDAVITSIEIKDITPRESAE